MVVSKVEGSRFAESVHTHLMFQNGRGLEALRRYEEIFESGFTIDEMDTYKRARPAQARFNLRSARCSASASPASTVRYDMTST